MMNMQWTQQTPDLWTCGDYWITFDGAYHLTFHRLEYGSFISLRDAQDAAFDDAAERV